MTGQAERIREAHRGARRAAPALRSRIIALDSFRLRYERVDDFNVVVEGEYQLNLAMSFWRSIDGTAQGYLVSTLDAEIKRKNSEKPADPDTAAELTTPPVAIAESVTGSNLPEVASSSLLPVVML